MKSPSSLSICNISFNSFSVECPVLSNDGNKLSFICENLGPCFNCCNIFVHSFAVSQKRGKVSNDTNKVNCSLSEVTTYKIKDSLLNSWCNIFTIMIACFNFGQVIVTNHSKYDACWSSKVRTVCKTAWEVHTKASQGITGAINNSTPGR